MLRPYDHPALLGSSVNCSPYACQIEGARPRCPVSAP